ncbi:hypothetical protein ABZ422_18130 [Micromonospora zamorensis]|uniref:hypothetical protein n=1 Tax=Micromonospora zamorensis TaxID=709883 RepID=UPI0033F13952
MGIKLAARTSAVLAVALLGGALVAPSSASAAQWNNVTLGVFVNGTVWENYVRSHTSTSDIKFDMNDGSSSFRSGTASLKYESNGKVFATKSVGLSSVTMVSNWGATRFRFGFNAYPGSGTLVGSLYY